MRNLIIVLVGIFAFTLNMNAQDTISDEIGELNLALAGVPTQPIEEDKDEDIFVGVYENFIMGDKIYLISRSNKGGTIISYPWNKENMKSFSTRSRLMGEPLSKQEFRGLCIDDLGNEVVYDFLSGETNSLELNYTQEGNTRSPFFSFQKNHRLYTYSIYKGDSGEILETKHKSEMVYNNRASFAFFFFFGVYFIFAMIYIYTRKTIGRKSTGVCLSKEEEELWGWEERHDKGNPYQITGAISLFFSLVALLLRIHQSGIWNVTGWHIFFFIAGFVLIMFPYVRISMLWLEHGKVPFKAIWKNYI